MTTQTTDMSDDRSVLRARRARPGQSGPKAFLLEKIREVDASITHFIIAYSAGDKLASENLDRLKLERAGFVATLRNITKD